MHPTLGALERVWQPHAGQRAFLEADSKIKVLACGRRWGKTDACAAQIAAAMLGDKPTRHLIVAPTLDQARLLFDRLIDLLQSLGAEDLRIRRTPYPRLAFGIHSLVARSGFLGRALRGNEATHIVVDEAAFVPEEIVTEVAMPMLATTGGSLTLISTPCGQNHFWRFYQMGLHGEHGVWSRRAPTAESPFVQPQFIEVQRELISDRAFRVEYEAEFLDSVGRVFRTECIDACLVPRLPDEPAGDVGIGIDWARYTDYTAIAVLGGCRTRSLLLETDRYNKMPWKDQIARAVRLIERYPGARVVCDQTGVGDPVFEELRAALPQTTVEGMVFKASTKPALIDNLAWMVENGALLMEPYPELLRELQHFESKLSDGGRAKLQARSGFHDDLVVALALAASLLPKRYDAPVALGRPRQFRREPPKT